MKIEVNEVHTKDELKKIGNKFFTSEQLEEKERE